VSSPQTASLTLAGGLAESPRLVRGARIGGRYEVREELGRGGYGVVFDAWDHELRRPVALKIRRADRSDPVSERRFRVEAALARDVAHPNLVRAFDIGVEGDLLYLVLEKIDGSTLTRRIEAGGPLRVEPTLSLAEALLEALEALHGAGIVHRDVKPSNVLLISETGDTLRVKLGDLGVARKLDALESRLTLDENVVGTLAYLPPEILRAEEATFRSDLYSLGVTLCEALLGRLPGGSTNTLAKVLSRRRSNLTARELRAARPELPRWLAQWLGHLLEPDPERRYVSAAAALADLRRRRSPGHTRRLARWLGIAALAGLALATVRLARGSKSPEFRGIRADGEDVVAVGSRGQRLWKLENVRSRAIGGIPLVRLSREGETALAVIRNREDQPLGVDGAPVLALLDPETGSELRLIELEIRPPFGVFRDFSHSFLPQQVQALDLNEDGVDEVVVVLNHIPSWPSVVVLYEPAADRSRVVFTGAGHQALLAAGDLDGDGRKELLFSGYSSVLRRLRVLSAVKVVPWIGTGVVVPGRETAASAELASGPGTNFVWQVLLGRRGIESLSLDDAAKLIRLRLEDGRRFQLRFDGSDPERSPAVTETERAAQEAAYASLREMLRLLSLAEWKLGAAEAARAQAHALRAVDPRLAEISKRFQGMAQIRAGEVSRGLASLATLWETSEDASEIAYDAAEALHLSGHLESAVEWYRRSALQGGAMHLGKSKKDVLLSEVLALVELGRSAEARDRIVWYQTSYGWTNTEVSIATLRSYIDWRAGAAGSDLATFSAISSLGYGWEWSLLALEFRLSAGESPITLLPEVERLESLVTEGRGLFVLIRAELLHRLGRTSEAKIITAEAGRLLKPHQEVFEFALRDVAAERLKRLGVN
jgi:hypothetical protein